MIKEMQYQISISFKPSFPTFQEGQAFKIFTDGLKQHISKPILKVNSLKYEKKLMLLVT